MNILEFLEYNRWSNKTKTQKICFFIAIGFAIAAVIFMQGIGF